MCVYYSCVPYPMIDRYILVVVVALCVLHINSQHVISPKIGCECRCDC